MFPAIACGSFATACERATIGSFGLIVNVGRCPGFVCEKFVALHA